MSDLFYGFSRRIGAQLGTPPLWILVWVAVAALAALALGGTWLPLRLGLIVVVGVALLPLYGAQLPTPGAVAMQAIRRCYQNFLPQVV